jgi:hypothetical protein
MLAPKIAIVLAASSLVSVVIAADCEASTGYKDSVCGSGDSKTCCKYNQKCLEIKPYEGDKSFVCSEARQLSNTKAVKIVIVPLFFMFLEVALVAYLVLRCDPKGCPTTILCVVVIALAWPFLFCKYWAFGAYTMLLAALIACASASQDFPKMPFYIYRLIWAFGIFQVIAFLGPLEAFHVPLFGMSNVAGNTEFIKNVYTGADPQGDCNTYYKEYFKIIAAEKNQKNFDPDLEYYGYCAKNWLATVQAFAVVQTILWMGLVLLSGRDLLVKGGDKDAVSKMP